MNTELRYRLEKLDRGLIGLRGPQLLQVVVRKHVAPGLDADLDLLDDSDGRTIVEVLRYGCECEPCRSHLAAAAVEYAKAHPMATERCGGAPILCADRALPSADFDLDGASAPCGGAFSPRPGVWPSPPADRAPGAESGRPVPPGEGPREPATLSVRFFLDAGLEYVEFRLPYDPFNRPVHPATDEDRARWPIEYFAFLADIGPKRRPAEPEIEDAIVEPPTGDEWCIPTGAGGPLLKLDLEGKER